MKMELISTSIHVHNISSHFQFQVRILSESRGRWRTHRRRSNDCRSVTTTTVRRMNWTISTISILVPVHVRAGRCCCCCRTSEIGSDMFTLLYQYMLSTALYKPTRKMETSVGVFSMLKKRHQSTTWMLWLFCFVLFLRSRQRLVPIFSCHSSSTSTVDRCADIQCTFDFAGTRIFYQNNPEIVHSRLVNDVYCTGHTSFSSKRDLLVDWLRRPTTQLLILGGSWNLAKEAHGGIIVFLNFIVYVSTDGFLVLLYINKTNVA